MQQQSSYSSKTNSMVMVFGKPGLGADLSQCLTAASGVPATLGLRLTVPQGAGTEKVKIVAIPTVL
jgi:hypothetical protein